MLLSREEFKRKVFARDRSTCVVCYEVAVDAHHLIERKLWPDGGYYVDNGVSLCEKCHIKAESTEFSVDFLRKRAKILTVIVPPGFPTNIDKWGFIIGENDV